MDRKKIEFMKEAIKLAQTNVSSQNGGPFGAVVVRNGKIIGKGANMVTSNIDPTAHAEIVAIRDACKNLQSYQLDDCEIYTSCEPCPMCLGAIYWARAKKIYYACTKVDAKNAGFDDSYIYDEIALPLNDRKISTEQLLQDNARKVFIDWENSNNKIEY